MAVSTLSILAQVPWGKLLEEAPTLWRQATIAADSVNKLLSDLKKPGPKKESAADAVVRLSGEIEALAANQQQLATVLSETSAMHQIIVAKIAQTRKILFVSLGVGCANLALLAVLFLIR